MLLYRIITGLSVAAIAAAALFALPAWAFTLLVLVFIVLGLNEFFTLVASQNIRVNKKLGIVLGALVAVATYYDYKIPHDWFYLFIPAICLIVFIVQFTKRDKGAVLSMSTILFGLLYVAWFLSFFIRLRTMPVGSDLLRRQLIGFLILVTKSGDIGAYVIGSKWGRHSLIPRISPKKTIEGAVGGLILSICAALVSITFLPFFSLLHLLILGLALGALAQIGDLSESFIKRDCGAKDAGKTLPGLGGVLDTLDSLLFTAPVFYFYVKVFIK